MVFGFAKQSGGSIDGRSEEGKGASSGSIFRRPTSSCGPLQRCAAGDDDELRGGSETILCVEDDNVVRALCHRPARKSRLQGDRGSNAAEALAIVEAGTAFDLLFTDIVMPGNMNGRQLAAKVADAPAAPGALHLRQHVGRVRQERVGDSMLLLTKPYRKAELARMVRHCLDQALDPVGDPIPLPYSVQPDLDVS